MNLDYRNQAKLTRAKGRAKELGLNPENKEVVLNQYRRLAGLVLKDGKKLPYNPIELKEKEEKLLEKAVKEKE